MPVCLNNLLSFNDVVMWQKGDTYVLEHFQYKTQLRSFHTKDRVMVPVSVKLFLSFGVVGWEKTQAMKKHFNVTNLVIFEYWVNSLLTATRTRSSQVQLGDGGMHQCYSLKTAVLKTCFCPIGDLPRTLQKDSQGLGCQKNVTMISD